MSALACPAGSGRLGSWLRRQLLGWFSRHRRDLPWRQTRDPYAVLVSEVMLQQTQVATVLPYYQRFVARFPNLAALANASQEEVLLYWEGLGYYWRARDLHQAARFLTDQYQGQFPQNPCLLQQLPGMGRYTAAAVLSLAFDIRLPIVEANSQRVLCRFFGLREDPRKNPLKRRLWEIAAWLLPRRRVGEYNQALMELGALVCTANGPSCAACPLARQCRAREEKLQEAIPLKAPPPVVTILAEVAVVIRRGRQVLLVQRPPQGRWPGLWEFPHLQKNKKETPAPAAARAVHQLTNLQAEVGPLLQTMRHSLTRFRIHLDCFEATYRDGVFASSFYSQGRWLNPELLPTFPLSAPQRRLAQKVVDRCWG